MPKVLLLFADRRVTGLLQSFDVFEKGKVVLQPVVTAAVVEDFGTEHAAKIRQYAEAEGQHLVAVYNDDEIYYRDPDVMSVSDGRRWCLLSDILPTPTEEKPCPVLESKRSSKRSGKR